MLRIQFHFLSGRYHATPWGTHVNEGAVEWPPSPWRLWRALVATGFNRLGWSDMPEQASRLFEALSSALPVFHLAPAQAAHTRHYMPQFKGSTAKVLDVSATFPERSTPALFLELDVTLDAGQLQLLDALLAQLTYLGRAESWVEAQRVEALPAGLERCAAGEGPPGLGYERLALLAPLTPPAFTPWRSETLVRMQADRLATLRASAEAKGKAVPDELKSSERAKLESLLPQTLSAALLADTKGLQEAGWSQPPGTRWVSYWRPLDALSARSTGQHTMARSTSRPTLALLALTPDTQRGGGLPRLDDVVLRMDALHKALVSAADPEKLGRAAPACFTGLAPDGVPLEGHQHASFLGLSLESARRSRPSMDHVLVWVPAGLGPEELELLQRVRVTWASNLPRLFVSLAGHGSARDLAPHVPQARRARAWVSYSPYVAPRHCKPRGKNTLVGQVRAELQQRGLPSPVHVEVELADGSYMDAERLGIVTADPGLSRRWRHFRRERPGAGRPPGQPSLGLRLVFDEEVSGPLAIGHGAHFGLGQFVPAPDR